MGRFRIKTYLRLRPTDMPSPHITYDGSDPTRGTVRIDLPHIEGGPPRHYKRQLTFHLDSIIQGTAQEEVYEKCAKDLVAEVLTGYQGTIIAYGQVGSGKTFTMKGDIKPFVYSGLIPRCINSVFEEKESKPESKIGVFVSYLEVYNEVMRDLLSENPSTSTVITQETLGGVMEIKGLSKTFCKTETQALKLFFEGHRRRSTASHPLSQTSSRSHTIFTIYVERHCGLKTYPERTAGKLNLVDLAGTDKYDQVGIREDLVKETMGINKSLTFLEQAVSELRKGQGHVCFRQSCVTTLLRDALGGNSKTILIACAWADDKFLDETISTLRFAQRVRDIKTDVKITKLMDHVYAQRKYESQIANLKEELALKDILNGKPVPSYDDITDEVRSEIRNYIKDFLSGADVNTIPVRNLAQVKETFSLFKEAYSSVQKELDKIQAELRHEPDQHPVIEFEDEDGVGELEPQGFHVGVAPLDARPDNVERVASPVKKSVNDEVISALTDQKCPQTKDDFSPEEKNMAFIDFKRTSEDGQKYTELIKNKSTELRLKKQFANEVCNHITEARKEISDLTKILQTIALQKVVDEEEEEDEEEEQTVLPDKIQVTTRLKEAKAEYRRAFEAFNQVKEEIKAIQTQVKNFKRDLLESFYRHIDGKIESSDLRKSISFAS